MEFQSLPRTSVLVTKVGREIFAIFQSAKKDAVAQTDTVYSQTNVDVNLAGKVMIVPYVPHILDVKMEDVRNLGSVAVI